MAHVIAADVDFLGLGVALLAPTAPDAVPKVRAAEAPGQAGPTDNLPVTLEPRASIGATAGHATLDDYYETIHVRPALVDVGRLTSSVSREVEVWSAYRDADRTLEQLDITAGDGINLSGPGLPFTFGPLESTVFTLAVTPEGPATIDARYDLVFSTQERDPHWAVVGTRLIEWTLAPNWQGRVKETYRFKTEVLTAFDGTEQRIALRHRPRREFAFDILADGDRDREMRRLLSTWQNRTYAMADWPRGVGTSGVPTGGQSVLLQAPIEDLEVGGLIVLRHGDRSQALEVQALNGDLVTLNSPVAECFPVGTRAYRGLIVHAEPQLRGQRRTAQVGQLSADFREMHIASALQVPAATTIWRGLEVLTRHPNWRESPGLQPAWAFDWLDADRGAFDYRTPHDAPKDVRRFTFTLASRADVAELRDTFLRAKGQRGELFVPTWDADLELREGALFIDGTTQLPIRTPDDASRMTTERVYRNVCVRLTDGTQLYRHVVAGGFNNEDPVLVVDAPWPRNIEAHEIVAIHWMPRCRFGSDQMTVQWVTSEVAEITLAFQVLEDVEEGDL
ncbi:MULTISPECIES: hypothetical protein [Halomonas]|uniref:Phage tail protein n=1 Tax=Halomonas halophila TaxID=29573 RepID=A0ABQ0TZC2_9GAMM|nr:MULTISPECIES: hypothetical protein [Halomonas]MDR5889628.1 hypothetical protein [Halomonas salina]WJY06310.1 hypothetical protein QWG60_11390 [Halomonas halophila]GEK71603.1 hypothetical protein HHA04nite_01470 [Halomonas halophila]